MAELELKFDMREVDAAIKRLEKTVGDSTVITQAIQAEMTTDVQFHFEKEEGETGAPWKKSRRAIEQSGRSLQDTGALRNSIIARTANSIREVTKKSATIGTNLKYARIHNEGGVIKPKTKPWLKFQIPGVGWRTVKQVTIPKREYMWLSDKAVDNMRKTTEDIMKKSWDGK